MNRFAKQLNTLHFFESDTVVRPSHPEETILEMALREKVPLFHSCGGNATCGTCAVEIIEGSGHCNPRTETEIEFFEERGWDVSQISVRLACQTTLVGGPVVVKAKYK